MCACVCGCVYARETIDIYVTPALIKRWICIIIHVILLHMFQ